MQPQNILLEQQVRFATYLLDGQNRTDIVSPDRADDTVWIAIDRPGPIENKFV